MSFELRPRWSTADWITNVVTRYAHERVGRHVSAETAAHKQRAYGCWAGTSRRHVTLRVRAVKFPNRDVEGDPGYALRAWFAVSQPSMNPAVITDNGSIGNQDAFYCNR
jgi:hypothetical protein